MKIQNACIGVPTKSWFIQSLNFKTEYMQSLFWRKLFVFFYQAFFNKSCLDPWHSKMHQCWRSKSTNSSWLSIRAIGASWIYICSWLHKSMHCSSTIQCFKIIETSFSISNFRFMCPKETANWSGTFPDRYSWIIMLLHVQSVIWQFHICHFCRRINITL